MQIASLRLSILPSEVGKKGLPLSIEFAQPPRATPTGYEKAEKQ